MRKVAIIGTGRVGLPLGLSLKDAGLDVFGIDKNRVLIEKVNSGEMPFHEPGYSEILKKGFKIFEDISAIKDATDIIITVGTPLLNHVETDLSFIKNVLHSVIDNLRPQQNIIMRSTIAPGTMEYVKNYLESNSPYRVGTDIFLSYCPERLAEGKAYNELKVLPQVIGAGDPRSQELAEEIFLKLSPKIHKTNFVNAELTKICNNIFPYIKFATANYFAYISEHFGGNIYEILKFANEDYPRGGIPVPGFSAGTCLRKDFGMINEHFPFADILISAWKINEFTPKFLVDTLSDTKDIKGSTVGILGYTFKKDADDIRDSLVVKLYRYIERKSPKVILISDFNIKSDFVEDEIKNLDQNLLRDVDILFVGANHTGYTEFLQGLVNEAREITIVDIWNVGKQNKLVYTNKEIR